MNELDYFYRISLVGTALMEVLSQFVPADSPPEEAINRARELDAQWCVTSTFVTRRDGFILGLRFKT